jgi:hypothetical protein
VTDDPNAEIARLNHALRGKADELRRARTEIKLLQDTADDFVKEILHGPDAVCDGDEPTEQIALNYVRALETIVAATLGALLVPADGQQS